MRRKARLLIGYDIIGDVHGRAALLEDLLIGLGYRSARVPVHTSIRAKPYLSAISSTAARTMRDPRARQGKWSTTGALGP